MNGQKKSLSSARGARSSAFWGLCPPGTTPGKGALASSPQEEIELGRRAAIEVSRLLLLLKDAVVDSYLNGIVKRLTAKALGFKYPYIAVAVNDLAINAFSLPGGYLYVNRGVIEAAENEAQLAGVIAHEVSHVALRHGTVQAWRTPGIRAGVAVLSCWGEIPEAVVARFGSSFTPKDGGKDSQQFETDADRMAMKLMSKARYDPRALKQFLEQVHAPNCSPANAKRRIENLAKDMAEATRASVTSRDGPPEFDEMKSYVRSLPAPPKKKARPPPSNPGGKDESRDFGRFATLENPLLRIDFPASWQTFVSDDAIIISRRITGIMDRKGEVDADHELAEGVLVGLFQPPVINHSSLRLHSRGFAWSGNFTETSTEALIESLRKSNPRMRVSSPSVSIDLHGAPGLSTYLSNASQISGGVRHTKWLITQPHQKGLLFIVLSAAESDFRSYEATFRKILDSVRVKRSAQPRL